MKKTILLIAVFLSSFGLVAQINPEGVSIISRSITFEPGKIQPTDSTQWILNSLVNLLTDQPDMKLVMVFTYSPFEINGWKISSLRSDYIRKHLAHYCIRLYNLGSEFTPGDRSEMFIRLMDPEVNFQDNLR